MSTSGSYNFELTRDNLIEAAHKHIGAVEEGDSCTTAQINEGAVLLNMIVKLRAADGMPLWALKRGTILPQTGVSSVQTNSHVVTSYTVTTLTAGVSSGGSTINITTAGPSNGDQIGIELSDGTMQWTTVNSGGGTTTLVLANTLTGAAGSGASVYGYSVGNRIQRPLRIVMANMLNTNNNASWEIMVISQQEYYMLGSRTSTGVPNQIYYDAALGDNTADPAGNWYGNIYIYPRFPNGDSVIEFTYHRPFQDFDSASDNIDFPQEFYLPLMLELAAILGPKNSVPVEERARLFSEAEMYREMALNTVQPEGSVKIMPDRTRMY